MKDKVVLQRSFLCVLLVNAAAVGAAPELRKEDDPVLRLVSRGSGALCADAIMVSSTARYNDGSPAKEVLLGPFDGIVIEKLK